MADIKIVNLPAAEQVNPTDIMIIDNNDFTKKVTVSQLKDNITADKLDKIGDAKDTTVSFTDTTTDTNIETGSKLSVIIAKIKYAISLLTSHIANVSNPHSVTKTQVGLSNVDNTADTSKNVLSATKLTTARDINIIGDSSGSVTFDGTVNTDISLSRKGCIAGGATAGWYKVASTSFQANEPSIDKNITFFVSCVHNSSSKLSGVLRARIRSSSSSVVEIISLDWIDATSDIVIADFVLAYKTTSPLECELWVRTTVNYRTYCFDVLSESSRTVKGNYWTLYNPITPETAPTTGYTQLASVAPNMLGNIAQATRLTTTRNIAISGDAVGTVGFNGTANVTIPIEIVDDSHNHIIDNVDGLQTILDAKVNSSEKAVANGIPTLDNDGKVPIGQIPVDQIQLENSGEMFDRGNITYDTTGVWADTNVDKTTLTGTGINFINADDSVVEIINIQGKYSQTTTVQGKNLFDKAKVSTVKYILPTNGVVTTSSYNNTVSAFIPVNTSGIYTISGHTFVQPNVPVGLAWYTNAGVYISGTSYQTATGNGTYTAPATAAYVRYTVNTTNLNVSQFESGSTATTFADYVPNSPTPDYPSPILNVGDTPFYVGTSGKNWLQTYLWSVSWSTQYGVSITVSSDGTVTLNGTATSSFIWRYNTMPIVPGTYSLSMNNPVIGHTGTRIQIVDSAGTLTKLQATSAEINGKHEGVTIADTVVQFWIRCESGQVYNNFTFKPQLERNPTATPYEPYKSNQTTISDMVLGAVPDGTKDEFISDGATAKVITRTKTITKNSGAITFADLGNGNISSSIQLESYTTSGSGTTQLSAVCNKLKQGIVNTTVANTFYVMQHQDWSGVRIGICIPKIYLTSQDIAGVNAWLAFNPLTIRYTFVTSLKPAIETTHSRIFNTSYKGITNAYTNDLLQPTFTGVAKSFAWNKYYNIDNKIGDITTERKTSWDNKAQYGDIKTLTDSSIQHLNGNDGLFEITNIKGKYSQTVTTQGKNILPDSFSEWETGQYNVTDGLKTTSTSRVRLKRLVPVTPSTQYYVYIGTTSFQYAVRGYDITGAFVQSFGAVMSGSTMTIPSTVYYISMTLVANPDNATLTYSDYQTAFSNGTIKPMVCLNSLSDKTYVPFIPNSPSPDYPSPILNVGDTPFEAGACGKNWLNPDGFKTTYTSNGITMTKSNGVITLNGTATAISDIYILNNTGFTNYYTPTLELFNRIKNVSDNICLSNNLGLSSYYRKKGDSSYVQVPTPGNIVDLVFIRIPSGMSFSNTELKVQLEIGNVSTDYEPYKGNTSQVYNNLGALPDGTINEYVYDGTTAKVIYRKARITFNGTETVTLAETLTNTLRFTIAQGTPNRKDDDSLMVCSHFRCTVRGTTADNEHIRNSAPSSQTTLVIYINKSRLATQDAAGFKAWLAAQYAAGTPLTVDYLLDTALESSLERIFTTQYIGQNNVYTTDNLQPTFTVIARSELWSNTYNAVYLSNESDITSTIPREADLFDGHDANYYKALINDVYTKIPNQNLLINGDYFPIWQRGTSFSNHGNGNWMYTADRWRVWEVDSVTKVSNGVSVKKYSTSDYALFQTVLEEKYDGKTVTGSICIDGNTYKLTGVMSTTALTLPITGIGTFRVYIANNYNFVDFVLADNNTHVFNWVKLELGSVATPIYPRTYAEELALCQRYYEKSYNTSVAPSTATTSGALFGVITASTIMAGFTFRVTKRTTPLVYLFSPSGTANKVWVNTDSDSSATITPSNVGENGVRYLGASTATLINGSNITYHYVADADIY